MNGRRTSMVRATGRAAALTAGMALFTFAAYSASLTVSETGSTLILPLFKAWVTGYAKVDPDLNMTLGAFAAGLLLILLPSQKHLLSRPGQSLKVE